LYVRTTQETTDSKNYEEIIINNNPNDKDNNAKNNYIISNNNDQNTNTNNSVCVGKKCCYQNVAQNNEHVFCSVNNSHNHYSSCNEANSLNKLSLSRHSSISQLSNFNCNKNINSAFYHYSHLHGVSTTPTQSRSRCSHRDSSGRSRRSRSDGSIRGSRHESSCSRSRTPASYRGSIYSEYDYSLRDGTKPPTKHTDHISTSEISYSTLTSVTDKKCHRVIPKTISVRTATSFVNQSDQFRDRSNSVVSTDEQTKNYYYYKKTNVRPSSSNTLPVTLAKRSLSGPSVREGLSHYDRLPSRAHSCGDSRSLDDIDDIPEYFDSPSKIQWNFFLNLEEQTKHNKQREQEQKSNKIEKILIKSSQDEVKYFLTRN
jgi:hypothetical protein